MCSPRPSGEGLGVRETPLYTHQIAQDAAMVEHFASQGSESALSTAEQVTQIFKEDLAKWARVIPKAGVKVE